MKLTLNQICVELITSPASKIARIWPRTKFLKEILFKMRWLVRGKLYSWRINTFKSQDKDKNDLVLVGK